MRRRDFLVLLTGAGLVGACASSKTAKTVQAAFSGSFVDAKSFEADYPDRLPYASMAVKFSSIPWALVVLAKAENGDLHWHSADRNVLVTRNGRLLRTAGLAENLTRTTLSGSDFFDSTREPEQGAGLRREIDFAKGGRYGVVVNSSLNIGQQGEFLVGRRLLRLRLFEEYCNAPAIGWSFVNRFWVDQSFFVWRSEQHIAPGFPPVLLEVMKPYRG